MPTFLQIRITSYNVCYTKLLRGIEGDVIIQYDIDSLFNYKNIEGISGDSILMKIVIRDIKKFSKTRADILTKISVVIEDCSQENVKDTIRFRLQ